MVLYSPLKCSFNGERNNTELHQMTLSIIAVMNEKSDIAPSGTFDNSPE